MNVGDYVRTKKGTIYQFNSTSSMALNGAKKYMVKTSPNIIDLIEIGDYVNGYKVAEVTKNGVSYAEEIEGQLYDIGDIKTIVTHEQMEAMQYRVEE